MHFHTRYTGNIYSEKFLKKRADTLKQERISRKRISRRKWNEALNDYYKDKDSPKVLSNNLSRTPTPSRCKARHNHGHTSFARRHHRSLSPAKTYSALQGSPYFPRTVSQIIMFESNTLGSPSRRL